MSWRSHRRTSAACTGSSSRLKTDCGIEGVGEIYAATFHPKAMVPIIDDVFERHLEGHDPHHIERLWRQCYSSGFTQRPDLTMMGVLSGLEMACWDIIGKAAGKPVYELMGGLVHERLRTYTYLYPRNDQGEYDYNDVDLAAECAARNVEEGFTAVKFDPAGPYTAYSGHQLSLAVLRRCETFCRRIREAVGDRADLLFGTHGQMTPSFGDPAGAAAGAVRSALVRGADPARAARGDGAGGRQDDHPDRHRRAPDHQVRVLRSAARRWCLDPADERRQGRRPARGQEDREHGRGVRRADRTAPLQRPDRGGRQHPARRLHARTS